MFQYPVEGTVSASVTKTLIHRQLKPEAFLQITPRSAQAQNPKDCVQYQTIIAAGSNHVPLGRNQILEQLS